MKAILLDGSKETETHINTFKWYRIFSALICLTLMLVLTIGNVKASVTLQGETDFAAIDAYVTTQLNDLGIPGMALGIVQDGQIAHLQGFGVADSSGRAVTPQTPFYIASLTKSFTALAVMQLVEAGKIDLDAPVQTYLPWFELADKEASAKITVRYLLNHTTGISGKDGNRDWTSQQGLEETVRGLDTIQLTQPVGITFQYSNLNWSIAGLIVEKVSGQSYVDYVTQHIFEPLDMRHSYASRAPALADGLAEEHHLVLGHAFKSERAVPPAYLPSGFLISSVEDMTHYAVAQLNDGRYGDTSIFSPQGIEELHAPAIPAWADLHYAMGWEVGTLDGMPIVSHTGDDGSNHSMVILMPDRGLGIVLLANASGFEQNPQINQIAEGVVSLLNANTPAPLSPPIHYSFLYWTILLTPFLMILGIVYSWRYWRNKGVGHILLVALLYGGVALLWLCGVPLAIGQPIWTGMRFFHPELAYGLILGAAIGIGWSVIYTVMNLRGRRSKQDFRQR
jgi:CubicO group peptidase (beta-lactamase class C family)